MQVREKNLLTCQRASPPKYKGARLVEVPLDMLDCNFAMDGASRAEAGAALLPLLLLCLLSARP